MKRALLILLAFMAFPTTSLANYPVGPILTVQNKTLIWTSIDDHAEYLLEDVSTGTRTDVGSVNSAIVVPGTYRIKSRARTDNFPIERILYTTKWSKTVTVQ